MLALPLLVTTLTLAPTAADSRLELFAGGDVELTPFNAVPSRSDASMLMGGAGWLGLNLFVHRVHDDDAAPSLQPYLQRVGTLHVEGGAGGFSTSAAPQLSVPRQDRTRGWFEVAAWGYADRFLYGFARFGARYDSVVASLPVGSPLPGVATSKTLVLPVEIAGGLRVNDARLVVGWVVEPTRQNDADFQVPYYGGVYVEGYDVVRRRLELRGLVQLLDGGAYASGGATIYLRRRFGLGAEVHGSHGHPANAAIFDRAGAALTFTAWAVSRVAVRLSYSFDWWQYSGDSAPYAVDYVNVIGLTLQARPH